MYILVKNGVSRSGAVSLCEYKAVIYIEYTKSKTPGVCVFSLTPPRPPRVAHRARARETVCAVLCSDAHAHAVLCGVCPAHAVQSVRNRRDSSQHSVWGHRRDDTWGLSLEQATASIHSLSRVRLQFSEREMQVAPGGHTSRTTPPSLPPGVAHTVRWEYATLPRDPSRTTPASRTHKWCIVSSLGLGRSSRAVRACPLSPCRGA